MVIRANKAADGIGGHLSTFASSRLALRGRLQPLLPGQGRRPARRPRLLPGPRRTRHLRPGVPRGSARRGAARQLPHGGRRQRAVELSAPAAHARLLGVPDRVDGSRPDQLDLPRPIQQVPAPAHASTTRQQSNVWSFLGDGECDEPETLGAISLAGRAQLDNLTWVINCNLQRLDGPVRGNGKIIQELEGVFRGAGWNVIKVIWGIAVGRAPPPRRRRCPAQQDERAPSTASTSASQSSTAPTSASTSSGPTPGSASSSST